PLAGPVVVAACIIEDDVVIDGITDSKATTESSRVASFEQLVAHPGVTYAVIRIEHDEIDDINILQATLKGMRMAAERALQMKAEQVGTSDACTSSGPNVQLAKECMALVDGNRVPPNMPMQGDSLVFSIAAASIIAKVTRDRIMIEYDALYPEYGLAQHKGYPT
ncbi:rnhB, partial [Symbiodinium microadriaticum]